MDTGLACPSGDHPQKGANVRRIFILWPENKGNGWTMMFFELWGISIQVHFAISILQTGLPKLSATWEKAGLCSQRSSCSVLGSFVSWLTLSATLMSVWHITYPASSVSNVSSEISLFLIHTFTFFGLLNRWSATRYSGMCLIFSRSL